MTDRDDTTWTDNMPDIDSNPDDGERPHDPVIEGDTFEEHTVKRLGKLGGESLEEIHKEMDFNRMKEETDILAYQVCSCGNTLSGPEETYRCRNCTEVACNDCRIRLNRYNYCPECIRNRFGVTRDLYIALYLLDQGVVEPVDLIGAGTVDGNTVSVEVDDTASRLLDSGLVRTDGPSPMSTVFDDDDSLTADGKEVLEAGKTLYGDDPDIEKLERKITIQQVADNGR